MRLTAELPTTLPLPTEESSWTARAASLVKDPFAAEQSRD